MPTLRYHEQSRVRPAEAVARLEEHFAGQRSFGAASGDWMADSRMAQLSLELDPECSRVHLGALRGADGPAHPVALHETRLHAGPLRLPILAPSGWNLFLPLRAWAIPGAVEALSQGRGPSNGGFLHLPHVVAPQSPRATGFSSHVMSQDSLVLAASRWGGDWEAYWAARPDGIRREVPRCLRRLSESGTMEAHTARSVAAVPAAVLDAAFGAHAERWAREARVIRRRVLGVANVLEQWGTLEADWYTLEGNCLGLLLSAATPAAQHVYWISTLSGYQKFSPGNLLFARVLKRSFASGRAVVDFMLGDSEYKHRWTDHEDPAWLIQAPLRSLRSRCAFHLYRNARQWRGPGG